MVEAAPEKKLKGAGRKRKGDGDESESSGEDDEGKGSDDAKKGKRDKKGKGKKRKKLDIMAAVYDSDAGSSDKDKGKGSEDDERPELYDSDEDENRGAETKQGAKEEEEGSSPATKPEAPSLPTKGGGLLRRAERVESDDEEEMDFESTAGASLPEASTDDPALLNDEKLPAIRPSVDTDKALRTLRRIDDDE